MILGNVAYLSGNSDNGAMLANPSSSITLVNDFLSFVPNVLAESHTNERGRLGRTPVFLARYKSSTNKSINGIAVDANTALAITPDGIAEAMGSSAVALLRWGQNTTYSIEAGKPFSMKNMKFDQLLPGYKYNLNTGEIIVPQTASSFMPKQISMPGGAVILDGSGNQTDWAASAGSIKRLQSLLNNSGDVIGIISSPTGQAQAEFVNTTLASFNAKSKLIYIDEAHKNDAAVKADILSCGAFIFVSNSPDSAPSLLNASTMIGAAFIQKETVGVPMLFLSEDVMLAGETYIGGIYSSSYSSYYGILTQQPGLNIIKGMQFVPRFYQNKNNTKGYDYSESRIMGLFWSMAKSNLSAGLLIDAGTYAVILDNKIRCEGITPFATPLLLFDASNVKYTELSQFKKPGRTTPVQNASLVGASYSIIRLGEEGSITGVKLREMLPPNEFNLEQNYPNPFNPDTNIRFTVAQCGYVKLKVFDSLGREVKNLFDGIITTGSYSVNWNASENCSGVYFCRLQYYVNGTIKESTRKMVFMK